MKKSHWITLVIEWKDRQSRVDSVAVIEIKFEFTGQNHIPELIFI